MAEDTPRSDHDRDRDRNRSGVSEGGGPDVVRVWLITEDLPDAALAELSGVLDAGERERAAAYVSEVEGRRFRVAHTALRHIVAAELGCPADELRWERGAHGKPELAGTRTGVRTNLTHSGALSMVAVTGSRAVGVDVQHTAPGLNPVAMAKRYYAPSELEFVLAGRDPAEQAARFTGLWARKEAFSKALGGRLARVLHVPVLGLSVVGDDAAADRPGDLPAVPCRVADLAAPPGFHAAVALAGTGSFEVEQQQWDWRDAVSDTLSDTLSLRDRRGSTHRSR
jgi:4'-phosphopantetheinyl transferase